MVSIIGRRLILVKIKLRKSQIKTLRKESNMKTRICLILATLMVTLSLVGCQQSAAQTDAKVGESAKPAPPQNVCKTTWEENCSVKQASAATRRALEDLGLGGPDVPKTRTVRTRDPKTGKTVTKQVPIVPKTRTVTTLDPKTGRRTTKLVPINTGTGSVSLKSDGLSAIVKAKSVTGIEYDINILLLPPKSCRISMVATGPNPPDILKKHSFFIKQKISEAIQNPELQAVAEPVPYPKTVILEHEVVKVYEILDGWAKNMEFDCQSHRGDVSYKAFSFSTGSRINFTFKMRLIDTNKTKLQIDIQNYKGKEEFPMILKSLEDILSGLKEDKNTSKGITPATEKEK